MAQNLYYIESSTIHLFMVTFLWNVLCVKYYLFATDVTVARWFTRKITEKEYCFAKGLNKRAYRNHHAQIHICFRKNGFLAWGTEQNKYKIYTTNCFERRTLCMSWAWCERFWSRDVNDKNVFLFIFAIGLMFILIIRLCIWFFVYFVVFFFRVLFFFSFFLSFLNEWNWNCEAKPNNHCRVCTCSFTNNKSIRMYGLSVCVCVRHYLCMVWDVVW